MLLSLFLGGYASSPVLDDLEADADWVWSSTGEMSYVPIPIAADVSTVWSSTADATVATPVGLVSASVWIWTSDGEIGDAVRGPRNPLGNRAGSGSRRIMVGTVTGGGRGTVGAAPSYLIYPDTVIYPDTEILPGEPTWRRRR